METEIKAIQRKENRLVAIEVRPNGETNNKWKEIDDNIVANLYLANVDLVLSGLCRKLRRRQRKFEMH